MAREVIGKTETEVLFRGKNVSQTFYLCPALTTSVIIGVPFCKAFNLAPIIFPSGEQNAIEAFVIAVVAQTSLEKS